MGLYLEEVPEELKESHIHFDPEPQFKPDKQDG